MATILKSDIDNWYAQLNASRVRLGLPAIAVPTIDQGSAAKSTDAQGINQEFENLKTDEWLRYATYVDLGDISVGAIMLQDMKNAADANVDEINGVVCRNTCRNRTDSCPNCSQYYSDMNDSYRSTNDSEDWEAACSNKSDDDKVTDYEGTCSLGRTRCNQTPCTDDTSNRSRNRNDYCTNDNENTAASCTDYPVIDLLNSLRPM